MALLFYVTRRHSQYISTNHLWVLYTFIIAYFSSYVIHNLKKTTFTVFFQSPPNPDMPSWSSLKFCSILSRIQHSRQVESLVYLMTHFPSYFHSICPNILLETHLLFPVAKINETKDNPILLFLPFSTLLISVLCFASQSWQDSDYSVFAVFSEMIWTKAFDRLKL